MFADDICVFYPSVRWLQIMLHVCQLAQNRMGLFSTATKLFVWMFKAKSAKSTATPLLKLGGQYIKSVAQFKYLGIVLDTELSDDKDIQRQLRYQYCAAKKLRASFPLFKCIKNVLFRSFCTPMYASQLWCNLLSKPDENQVSHRTAPHSVCFPGAEYHVTPCATYSSSDLSEWMTFEDSRNEIDFCCSKLKLLLTSMTFLDEVGKRLITAIILFDILLMHHWISIALFPCFSNWYCIVFNWM